MKNESYIPPLDGIRALAILLVIPHNSNIYAWHAGLFWPLSVAAHAGWIGVQLFFVLSGFLISGALLDQRGSAHYYRSFYIRRALRILPLYYLALTLGTFLAPILDADEGTLSVVGAQKLWWWVFLNNWVEPFHEDVTGFSHFWSLAVEEQFYLLWPFVVSRWSGRALLKVCAVLTLVAFASRIALLESGAPRLSIYVFTICRMDALAIGSAAAVLIRDRSAREWMRRHTSLMAALCVVGLLADAAVTHAFVIDRVGTQSIGYPTLACAFALLVLATTLDHQDGRQTPLNRALSNSLLRSVGRYSYAMYVVHLPLAIMIKPWFETRFSALGSALAPLFALLIVVISYAFGFLSYRILERPILRLKSKFAPIAETATPVWQAGPRPTTIRL